MGQKIPKLKELSLAFSVFLLGMEQKQSSDQNLNNSLLNKQFDNLKHEPPYENWIEAFLTPINQLHRLLLLHALDTI